MPPPNKKPKFRSQKLENVSIALDFLQGQGVSLANIDPADIVDCKLKPILGLIWALRRRYNIQICYAPPHAPLYTNTFYTDNLSYEMNVLNNEHVPSYMF